MAFQPFESTAGVMVKLTHDLIKTAQTLSNGTKNKPLDSLYNKYLGSLELQDIQFAQLMQNSPRIRTGVKKHCLKAVF